jgi:hypothetical protein
VATGVQGTASVNSAAGSQTHRRGMRRVKTVPKYVSGRYHTKACLVTAVAQTTCLATCRLCRLMCIPNDIPQTLRLYHLLIKKESAAHRGMEQIANGNATAALEATPQNALTKTTPFPAASTQAALRFRLSKGSAQPAYLKSRHISTIGRLGHDSAT